MTAIRPKNCRYHFFIYIYSWKYVLQKIALLFSNCDLSRVSYKGAVTQPRICIEKLNEIIFLCTATTKGICTCPCFPVKRFLYQVIYFIFIISNSCDHMTTLNDTIFNMPGPSLLTYADLWKNTQGILVVQSGTGWFYVRE